MKRLILFVGALLIVGGGLYMWWFYGDLTMYVQRVINLTSETPEGITPPSYGTLVSQTEKSVTLKEDSRERTFTLAQGATVTSRTEAGAPGKYLRDIAPGTPLLFITGSSSPETISGFYLMTPYPEPESGETVLDGRLSENAGTTFVLLGPGTEKTLVNTSNATVYSLVASGVTGMTLSQASNGQQVRIVGKKGSNSFMARIIDIL